MNAYVIFDALLRCIPAATEFKILLIKVFPDLVSFCKKLHTIKIKKCLTATVLKFQNISIFMQPLANYFVLCYMKRQGVKLQ